MTVNTSLVRECLELILMLADALDRKQIKPRSTLSRGHSTISYSSLNSLRVIDRSRATSRTPLCANSMILDATKRVAGSSLSRRPNSAHTLSNTTDMLRIASGSKAAPLRNGRIGIAVPRRNDTRPMGQC